MTEREDLERQLIQCRRLSRSLTDALTVERLSKLADELEARIIDMDSGSNDVPDGSGV